MIKNALRICLLILLALFLGCKTNEKPKEETDILALIEAKLKKDPKNSELYYEQAKLLYKKDRLKDASASCDQAIKLKDNVPSYYLLRADIYLKQGLTDESFSAIEKALKLEPDNIQANLKLAELSLFLKNYDRVLELTKKVIELDKINSTAYFIRGYALKETGDTFGAVKLYTKVIEFNPESETAFEELGILYALKKDKLAIDYLNTAISLNPKNTFAMYALAMYYQEMNMPADALPIYENILSISSYNPDALHNIGYIELIYNADYKKAVEYFTKAIESKPDYVEAYFNRGISYEKMGEKSAAINDYKKVLEFDSGHKKAKEALVRLEGKK